MEDIMIEIYLIKKQISKGEAQRAGQQYKREVM